MRDVHFLVVAHWERKHHHISSSKDPVNICLHHLTGMKVQRGKNGNIIKQNKSTFKQVFCLAKHLVHSDEALGVQVDATLFQKTSCRNASYKRGRTSARYIRFWRKRFEGFLFDVTCSNDAHVCSQDLPTLQYNLFQLWGKNVHILVMLSTLIIIK